MPEKVLYLRVPAALHEKLVAGAIKISADLGRRVSVNELCRQVLSDSAAKMPIVSGGAGMPR
jgi:predicted HicB family RNase H-like nuclease